VMFHPFCILHFECRPFYTLFQTISRYMIFFTSPLAMNI